MGLFSQEKIRNRMREVFCKKNPFRPSTRKTKAEMTRTVPAPELSVTCTAMAWLLVEGVLPAALSSNAHRKGGQKAPGWLLRGGDRAFALVPAWERQTWAQSLQGNWHGDWSHGAQRPRVTCPNCHPMLIQLKILGRLSAAAQAEWAAVGSPDVHPRGRWVSTSGDLWLTKKPLVWWLLFSFPTNLITGEYNWLWTYLGNGFVAIFLHFLCSRKQYVGWKHSQPLLRKHIKCQQEWNSNGRA